MKRPAVFALALLPLALSLSLAWSSLDYGGHWDERYNKADAVVYSLNHDFTLLPDGYVYPGVNYWLTWAALSPELVHAWAKSGPDPAALRTALIPVLNSDAFNLRLRWIYSGLGSLTAVWIFLAVLVWGGGWPAALFGSFLWAASGEVLYHLRWVAPDAVLTQFGALTLFLAAAAWKSGSKRTLLLAAIAAGLATGTKYPGGLLLLPVLWTAAGRREDRAGWGTKLLTAGWLFAAFGAAYLVTTPGTVLQPTAFLKSIAYAKKNYADGWYGYTVVPGWDHLWRMLYYLFTRGFSAFPPIAIVFSLLALGGAFGVARADWRSGILLLVFPVVYIAYFSTQAILVVRNYLIVLPFGAFFAAQGFAWLIARLRARRSRLLFAAAGVALLAADGVDQIQAAVSVVHRRDQGHFLAQFVRYAERRPAKSFLVADQLVQALRNAQAWPRPNLHPLAERPRPKFDVFAGYYSELILPREKSWPTNRPGGFVAVFGARQVNLDYYILWSGSDQILCLSPALAAEAGLPPPAVSRR